MTVEKQTSAKRKAARVKRGDRLDATLAFNNLKITLSSDKPEKTLPELRKLLEVMRSLEDEHLLYEDIVGYELKEKLSSEMIENPEVMSMIKSCLGASEEYLVTRTTIDVLDEVDLERKRRTRQIRPGELKRALDKLFFSLDLKGLQSALVHIKGGIARAQRLMVLDHINRRLNYPKMRVFNTHDASDDKVLIEAVLFGDFQYERNDY